MSENNKFEIIFVDIGARDGIEKEWSKLSQYLKIYSFDPDTDSVINNSNNDIVFPYAIGAVNGRMPFYVCNDMYCSSLLKPNFEFLSLYPNWERFKIQKIINVEIRTLNYLYSNREIEQPDIIKIDAQGMSFDILINSTDILESAVCIVVECSYEKMYLDEILVDKIINLLQKFNFEIIDKKDFYWRKTNAFKYGQQSGNLVWCDLIFIKKLKYFTDNRTKYSNNFLLKYYLIAQSLNYEYESLDYIIRNKIISKEDLTELRFKNSAKDILNKFLISFTTLIPIRLLRYLNRILSKTILSKIGPIYTN